MSITDRDKSKHRPLILSREGRRDAAATAATCPLSPPYPLADAATLSGKLAKASLRERIGLRGLRVEI
jgi:hypothetical protein